VKEGSPVPRKAYEDMAAERDKLWDKKLTYECLLEACARRLEDAAQVIFDLDEMAFDDDGEAEIQFIADIRNVIGSKTKPRVFKLDKDLEEDE
jgi:hypothetical protein